MSNETRLASFAISVLLISVVAPSSISLDVRAQAIGSRFPIVYFNTVELSGEPIVIGQDVKLTATIENENRASANVTFISQIVNSDDIAVAIQENRTTVYPSDQKIILINNWRSEKAGFYRVEEFLIADERGSNGELVSYPISSKSGTATLVRPSDLDDSHDLRLEIQIENPENVTSGSLKGSIELVNYGNGSDIIKIEPDSAIDVWPIGVPRSVPVSADICEFWQDFELNDVAAFELPPHGRKKLIDGETISLPYSLHPDSYALSWNATLRVQEPDGVDCLRVSSEKVTFNVTASTYDDVRLVLETDKESYTIDQPVGFTIYIENDSADPFEINLDEIMIRINNATGDYVLGFSAGLLPLASGLDTGHPNVVVGPHSNYTFKNLALEDQSTVFWNWDQRVVRDEGEPLAVGSGTYVAYATFMSPPMKSDTIEFTIGVSI